MKQLAGKYAVVTGGTRGIGFAIAEKLKAQGAAVLITGTQKRGALTGFDYYAVDFTDADALNNFCDFIRKKNVDILINNAGTNQINPFCEIQLVDFARIQQLNVITPLQLCQSVIPYMKQESWGRIVNISSVWSKVSKAGRAAYTASKFALDGLTAALAAEVAPYGILANCVAPGFIETDLTKKVLGEEGLKEMANLVPMKRLGQPYEVAALVAWLVSPENTYLSGQNMVIDGGFTRV